MKNEVGIAGEWIFLAGAISFLLLGAILWVSTIFTEAKKGERWAVVAIACIALIMIGLAMILLADFAPKP